MKRTHRWSVFVAAVTLIFPATFLVSGHAGRAFADEQGGLGDNIAGTYLAVLVDGAQVLQISQDGNLSAQGSNFIVSLSLVRAMSELSGGDGVLLTAA